MHSLFRVRYDIIQDHVQLRDKLTNDSRSKIKCSAEQPACRACQKRDVSCIYDGINRNRPESCFNDRHGEVTLVQDALRDIGNSQQVPSGNAVHNDFLSPITGGDLTHAPFTDWLVNSPELSSGNQAQSRVRRSSANVPELSTDDLSTNFASTDFNYNLSWVFEESLGNVDPDIYDVFTTMSGDGLPVGHLAAVPHPQAASTFTRQLDGGDAPVQQRKRMSGLPDRISPGVCSPGGPLVARWHGERALCHRVLPALGKELQDATSLPRFYSTTTISSSTSTVLQEFLQLPFQERPWESLNLENFPSNQVLDYCIDLYFAHFNRVSTLKGWPFQTDDAKVIYRCYRSSTNPPLNRAKTLLSPWLCCVLELVTRGFLKRNLFRMRYLSSSIGY